MSKIRVQHEFGFSFYGPVYATSCDLVFHFFGPAFYLFGLLFYFQSYIVVAKTNAASIHFGHVLTGTLCRQ